MHDTFRSWRRGFLCTLVAFIPACSLTSCDPEHLDQGWSDAERTIFYYTTQGSRLIRRDWFLALERHDSEERFLDNRFFVADGLKRFGYLQESFNALNPDKLPIGFAVDTPTTREWIGMTCAACHTSDITYGGKTLRIDGAPAAADMYEFLSKLGLALKKAADDDAAFLRFAAKVLGDQDTPANRDWLRNDPDPAKGLRAAAEKFTKFVMQSTPASPWGPARLDAFGMIFNRVASIDLGIDGNSELPNAPVSYPFLWGTSWHDFTQWNGAVPNDGGAVIGRIRRLGRNVGQVLGVFGTIDFGTTPTYPSSAQRVGLALLEETVSKLTAPVWPDAIFGAPDVARVARGRVLYQSTCIGCHKLVPRDQQLQPAQVSIVPQAVVGTDDTMTKMAANRRADTGILQGRLMEVFLGRSIEPNERVTELLSHAVIGAMAHSSFAPPGATTPSTETLFDSSVIDGNYKARPLNGIWATGPYLHNGSVRTLFQVLLPVARREMSFHVGSREFDPVEVGFNNAPGVISFQLDTTVPGNRNTGHRFGDALSDEERKDLVEYLKTL